MQSLSLCLLRLGFVGIFVAQTGCVGTSVGNPPGADTSEVQLGVVAASDVKQLTHTLTGDVRIDEAWIALGDIGLQETGSCSKADGPVDYPGPVAADLLAGKVYPEPPMWERSAGATYCEMRVGVRRAGLVIEGAPPDLADVGVFVRGARGDGTPFELRADLDEELRLGASGKAEFALGGGPVGLLLAFNIDTWINTSLLNQAEVKDGVIRADQSDNSPVADSATQQIPGSAKLLRDQNRNGALDEGDDDL
jgi:hypothetical protein